MTKMKIPTATSCCCGCNLRLGSLIIGLITLIGSAIGVIHAFQLYYALVDIAENTDLEDPEIVEIREHLLAHQLMVYGFIFSSIVNTALAIVLLTGIYKETRRLVLSWVFGNLAMQILSILCSIAYCIVLSSYIYLTLNLFLFINLYFLWVAYSYAEQMDKGSTNIG